MRPTIGVLCLCLLVFTGILTAWLGVAGPVLTEASDKGLYKLIFDWQTLIGAALQLAAAGVAAWIVWGQLQEQRAQAAIQAMEVIQRQLILVIDEYETAEKFFMDVATVSAWTRTDELSRRASFFYSAITELYKSLGVFIANAPSQTVARMFLVGDAGTASDTMLKHAHILKARSVSSLQSMHEVVSNLSMDTDQFDNEHFANLLDALQGHEFMSACLDYRILLERERKRLADLMAGARRRAGL